MIETRLAELVKEAVQNLYKVEVDIDQVQIQPTRKEFEGEFTIVVFPFVKLSGKSPDLTAQELATYIIEHASEVEAYSVIKGFLNLKLKAGFWLRNLSNLLVTPDYGRSKENSRGLVMVEYSSPNTNKPLHLGHLRNIFLGDSVASILKAYGHEIKRVQIINDRGIHICKSMVAWKKFGEGESPETSGLKGDHLVGKYYVLFDKTYKAEVAALIADGKTKDEAEANAPIMEEARETLKKWEDNDPETYSLWEKMNEWVYAGFDITYQRMGVEFDKLYYESNTWSIGKDIALQAISDNYFYRKDDGSVWVDLRESGLDEKLILRKDGTAVYMTQDIGTAILRYRDFPKLTKLVYTVGNEQEYHFKVLFKILEKLGYNWAKDCYHLSYGMVELPEGKMKSREGTVVDADEIMETMVRTAGEITAELGKLEGLEHEEQKSLYESIGLAALKYFLLKVDPKKNMLFNPRESIDFNGHTGPFIQYTHARICSVLRKYGKATINNLDPITELSSLERRLQLKLYQFPAIIEQSALDYNPAHLANYLFELSKEFASFYQTQSILQAESSDLIDYRVGLTAAVGRVLKSGMELLGIDVPERM